MKTMNFKKLKKYILGTNWIKTLRINFHYFPFKQAIKLPILVAHRVVFEQLRGGVEIEGKLTTGMLLFGYRGVGFVDSHYNRTIWQISGKLKIRGSKIDIGRGSRFCVFGECSLGDRFSISGLSTIICNKSISFGDNVLLSWDVLVMDTDFHKIKDSSGSVINPDKGIVVEDNVWIGCRTTVLKGTYIPSNTVIAAGSIISGKTSKSDCVISSGKSIIKENISWER